MAAMKIHLSDLWLQGALLADGSSCWALKSITMIQVAHPVDCSQPVTEWERVTNAGPFPGDTGLLWWGTLAWALPTGFLERFLELHRIYNFSYSFSPVFQESWISIQSKGFPSRLQSSPCFPLTGVFPNKSSACLIWSYSQFLKETELTHHSWTVSNFTFCFLNIYLAAIYFSLLPSSLSRSYAISPLDYCNELPTVIYASPILSHHSSQSDFFFK